MIANFFNKTKPINTVAIIILLFVIYVVSILIHYSTSISTAFLAKRVAFFLLLIIILFSLNFIIRKNNLVKDNSYTLLLFVLLLGMFPFTVLDFKLAITNFILLLSYRRIYSLRTQKDTKEKLFDSAFWVGIATLIYPWSSLILILIFVAAFLFDKWTWRNVIIPIIGFVCPLFIYAIYLLAFNQIEQISDLFNYDYFFNFKNYNLFKLLIPLAIVLSLIIWAIFPTTLKIISVNNEFKSSWQLLITHFFIMIFVVLPWSNKNGSELLFLFFPITIIFTNYLQIVKEQWFKEVFLYSFLLLTIITYFL